MSYQWESYRESLEMMLRSDDSLYERLEAAFEAGRECGVREVTSSGYAGMMIDDDLPLEHWTIIAQAGNEDGEHATLNPTG